MQISSINNSGFNKGVNFTGVNLSKLCTMDLKHIKDELPKLEEIGKKYDISLKSCYEGIYDLESIDVVVSPLRDSLNFWTKIFGPKGKTTFYINKKDKSIIDKVNEAVEELTSKNKLGKLIDAFEK